MKDNINYNQQCTKIEQAFLNIILEENLNTITVEKILLLSKISRGTFYKYYHSKEDVLIKIQRKFFIELDDLISNESFYADFFKTKNKQIFDKYCVSKIESVIHLFEKYNSFLRVMIKQKNQLKFLDEKSNGYIKIFSNCLPESLFEEQLLFARSSIIYFIYGGAKLVIKEWLLGSLDISTEEISQLLCDLLYQVLVPFGLISRV